VSVETSIRAALLANAPVAAIVGGRIYPSQLPQKPTAGSTTPWVPAIVYQRITGDHPVDQDGGGGADAVRVQLDLWSQTYDTTADLRQKVLTALNGFAGAGLQGVFSESETDLYDDEVKLHRISMDFMAFEGVAA